MMIEIVVSPPAAIGITLGILNGHIGAIQRSGEITPSGGLGARTVGIRRWWQRELQLFEEDCPFRKDIRLLVRLI